MQTMTNRLLVSLAALALAVECQEREPLADHKLDKTNKIDAAVAIKGNETRTIKAPTMIVFGDADAVRPAHVLEFFELFGGGKKDAGWDGALRPAAQLAILPGLTHYDIVSAPLLATVVTPFLDAPLPKS